MDSLTQRFLEQQPALDILALIGTGFLLLVVAEAIWDRTTGVRRSLGQTLANVGIAAVNFIIESSALGLVFLLALYLFEPYAILDIPVTGWTWVAAVVVADFSYYWMHRIEHRVNILWSYHSVHHSSPEFNFSTTLRLAWVEGFVEWVFFIPMVLIGFDLVQTIVALLVVVTYQNWIHSDHIGRLGWLDWLFNTPSNHRVHHASNREYHDCNYGGILMLWDRLFGTYRAEDFEVLYGITVPVTSTNPFTINFAEPIRIARALFRARRFSDGLSLLFRPPGWSRNADQSR